MPNLGTPTALCLGAVEPENRAQMRLVDASTGRPGLETGQKAAASVADSWRTVARNPQHSLELRRYVGFAPQRCALQIAEDTDWRWRRSKAVLELSLRTVSLLLHRGQEDVGKATGQMMQAEFLVDFAYCCLPDAQLSWRVRVANEMNIHEKGRYAECFAKKIQVSETVRVLVEAFLGIREFRP
jgi:hypothetical protein